MPRVALWRAAIVAVLATVFSLPALPVPAIDAAGEPATLTADSLTTTNFSYVGTTVVGSTTALEFNLSDATLTGFVETGPCQLGAAGLSTTIHATSSGDLSLTGPVELVVTSLDYDGLAQPWTATTPPAVGPLGGPFTHITASALLITANSASATPHVSGQIC